MHHLLKEAWGLFLHYKLVLVEQGTYFFIVILISNHEITFQLDFVTQKDARYWYYLLL